MKTRRAFALELMGSMLTVSLVRSQMVVDPSMPAAGRDYIDPVHGEKLGDGSIRARRIDENEAYELYGRAQRAEKAA